MTRYARLVVAGLCVVGLLARLACERHLRDLKEGPKRGLVWDAAAAERAIAFFGFLRHSKGEWAGRPVVLEPWQQFVVGSLFGWKVAATGDRRFREAYEEVPRKNGKSTKAAGIGLLLFVFDGEAGAEVYAFATKKEQARIVWSEARRMVLKSPALSKRVGVYKNNLHVEATASRFEPLSADEQTADGLNVHGAIGDELHAHKNRGMVDVIETATGSRRQSLIFYITTSGYNRDSVCYEKHAYAEKVLRGLVTDDTFFALIFSIDEADDWTDERAWAKANPNLGVSVKLEDLRRKCRVAQQVPAKQNSFKRLHLGVWTEQSTRWLDIALWDRNAGVVDIEQLRGRRAYGGLDLASTTDVAAFVLVFPPVDEGEPWKVLPRFWIPRDTIDRRSREDRVPYDQWAAAGLVEATDGNITDYDVIRARIVEDAERFDICQQRVRDADVVPEIAYDRWNATQLTTQLTGEGFTMVPFGQGFASMAAPMKELEKLLLGGELAHGGNPVLRWMASNVAVRQDPAGNLKPDKGKSSERIDGIVALVMGLGRAMLAPPPEGSIYEGRGVLSF